MTRSCSNRRQGPTQGCQNGIFSSDSVSKVEKLNSAEFNTFSALFFNCQWEVHHAFAHPLSRQFQANERREKSVLLHLNINFRSYYP
jgi:hypothetical protein